VTPGHHVEPAYAWGIAIPSAVDGRYFMSQATCSTRAELLVEFGGYFSEDWRKGWRQAYRNGYRAVRVVIRPGFAS
jgi:hypothetical protein